MERSSIGRLVLVVTLGVVAPHKTEEIIANTQQTVETIRIEPLHCNTTFWQIHIYNLTKGLSPEILLSERNKLVIFANSIKNTPAGLPHVLIPSGGNIERAELIEEMGIILGGLAQARNISPNDRNAVNKLLTALFFGSMLSDFHLSDIDHCQ